MTNVTFTLAESIDSPELHILVPAYLRILAKVDRKAYYDILQKWEGRYAPFLKSRIDHPFWSGEAHQLKSEVELAINAALPPDKTFGQSESDPTDLGFYEVK